ncbi:class I SAM-dependent methyltransferase [Halobiforma nitratireducens]|uniref:Methyltransferase type 11 n=1 Tax=Halobiforma nitratireducens JCM 10879 TaxID=1227454 RepID=M0MCX6_9EURY|nr:class I SAM-dependent methyltransferase [Halobiforma nitratireducens]EMA42260.1 Methyltransferase type 11 [Halobiforma nitratireducens JCM 10879]
MDSNEVRRQWANRSAAYSPEYYAYHGPDKRSKSVRGLLERFVDRDASILELGCSSGRHLSHLADHGFEDLAGIELNGDAFDVMAESYPELAEQGTFHHAAIEDVVEEFEDGQFDAVYSVETLQHVSPDSRWVFAELARITSDLLVTVENEGDRSVSTESGDDADTEASTDYEVTYVTDDVPLYHRDWNRVFTDQGLVEVAAEAGKRDTVRAFRPPSSVAAEDR